MNDLNKNDPSGIICNLSDYYMIESFLYMYNALDCCLWPMEIFHCNFILDYMEEEFNFLSLSLSFCPQVECKKAQPKEVMFPPGTRGRARSLPYTMDAFMLGMGMLSECHTVTVHLTV